jgi:FkbM family methyltransferase
MPTLESFRRAQPGGCELFVPEPPGELSTAILAGTYELNELELVGRLVQPGMHVIDVGAHVGAYALRLAALVGETGSVTAIEPLPDHADCLLAGAEANGFRERVEALRVAAAECSGERDLATGTSPNEASHAFLIPTDGDLVSSTASRRVPVARLDDVARRRPVAFIKIDVEGAESLVIRGASQLLADDRPIVLMELHPRLMRVVSRETPAALIAAMAGLGYECRLVGAGVAMERIDDTPSNGITAVVFLPVIAGANAPAPCTERASV